MLAVLHWAKCPSWISPLPLRALAWSAGLRREAYRHNYCHSGKARQQGGSWTSPYQTLGPTLVQKLERGRNQAQGVGSLTAGNRRTAVLPKERSVSVRTQLCVSRMHGKELRTMELLQTHRKHTSGWQQFRISQDRQRKSGGTMGHWVLFGHAFSPKLHVLALPVSRVTHRCNMQWQRAISSNTQPSLIIFAQGTTR